MQVPVNPCCASARSVDVRMIGDDHDHPEPPSSVTQTSAKLLDGVADHLWSVPNSPFRDLKVQISDLRHRQEELFKQVMDQQSIVQSRLLAMHSSSEAIGQRQQDLISEIQELSMSVRENGMTNGKKMDDQVRVFEDSMMPSPSDLLVKESILDSAPSESGGGYFVTPTLSRAASKLNNRRSAARTSLASRASRRKTRSPTSVLKFSAQQAEEEEMDMSLKARVTRIVNSSELEFAIAGAIMLNAFVISCECQYAGLDVGFNLQFPGRQVKAHVIWKGAETAFTFVDWFFGALFLTEMIIKLLCWRWKYFWDLHDWQLQELDFRGWRRVWSMCMWSLQGWNLLDFICVLAFIFDKVSGFGSVNPQMIRLLRLFRLFRLVRLLRVLESLDHLYIMTTAISGLRRVLSWAIVFLTMMLLTCDLFLVQILHATYFNKVYALDLSADELRKHHLMYEYFGTCTRCMLSMFEITLGNWPPVARLLSEEVSEWFTLLMLTHKLTIGFAVIGVITGVILQETFKVAQTDDVIMFRNKKLARSMLRKKMKTLFEALDQDDDGKLKEAEFTAIGDFPEIECWLASLDIETDELKTLFSLIDVDGNGYITLEELLKRMPRIKGNARGIDMMAMRKRIQGSSYC